MSLYDLERQSCEKSQFAPPSIKLRQASSRFESDDESDARSVCLLYQNTLEQRRFFAALEQACHNEDDEAHKREMLGNDLDAYLLDLADNTGERKRAGIQRKSLRIEGLSSTLRNKLMTFENSREGKAQSDKNIVKYEIKAHKAINEKDNEKKCSKKGQPYRINQNLIKEECVSEINDSISLIKPSQDEDLSICKISDRFNFVTKLPKREKQDQKVRLRHFKKYSKCVILPDDPWKLKWNLFLVIVIWVSSFLTPIHVAFIQDQSLALSLIDYFIDLVFLLDIVFSFISAYYTRMEILEANRRRIAVGYLKSWFFIDLFAVIPLQFFANTMMNQLGKMARLPRVYKLMKTAKFMRNTKILKIRPQTKKKIARLANSSVQTERLIEFGLLFVILCHTLACMWYLVGRLQDSNVESWIYANDLFKASLYEKYISALYFIVATITTVGYGDISAETWVEQTFGIVLMIIGVISYSTAISSFMSIMNALDRKEAVLRTKLQTLSKVKEEYNLDFELYWRLRQSLHFDHSKDMTDKASLLTELPGNL